MYFFQWLQLDIVRHGTRDVEKMTFVQVYRAIDFAPLL